MSERDIIFSKSGGVCWYCGEKLNRGWHQDHFTPIHRGRDEIFCGEDTLANKVPACPPCNLFKSTFTVEEFRAEISKQIERARKSSVNFRTAERFGLIEIKSGPVVFWFERAVKNEQ